eukprot:CAMPEP_0170594304 /NCGR_PEP_ID=MMETSP0224-20130122/13926_1 /TAXON_ID=285029 /ORGANISM="Togula jolla, Strain CCCM 725" /LENGTH=30 /DNA_ID= /DNA_START= /DNA_END= /DNA_ORIENTATION=
MGAWVLAEPLSNFSSRETPASFRVTQTGIQ